MKKWLKSLQAKYLLLILLAFLALPISFPFVSMVVYLPATLLEEPNEPYGNHSTFEARWNKEADALSGAEDEQVSARLYELYEEFPDASMFWVNEQGETMETVNYEDSLPEQWSSSYTVQFMKNNYDNDPFTVVSFIGESEENQGFMVVQLDREFIGPPITQLSSFYNYVFGAVILLFMSVFVFLSWLFFKKFHKRLVRLQDAMERKGEAGIPFPVKRSNDDEIGQLEESFNHMIHELEESRQREQQEEKIRRELIANLSHDLRTPLTTIRAALNGVSPEVTSEQGRNKLLSVNNKIDYVSELIDNLFSFTLLTGKKYPYHPEKMEMNRFIRETAAHWYPALEEHEIEVDVQTLDTPIYWNVDPKWMERVFDNLLQNLVRYASDGRYAGLVVTHDTITVEDNGPGMERTADRQGAGIGLSIVELMTREMNVKLAIETNKQGTKVNITKKDADA
ncbi:sensor histidine kinase [Halobacillus amylolyticus]|uniref:histidine kinase n=1 Tax=Halobacillus amylolyticus TaxID=2932259 RepID=A0ABY4H8I6_9BACI|nr:HAMP domain-containing sensor histidine kinase [Halobacillus amylolyticus]UOR11181.1 HAMP domain-containing histidine kinase [Halobacillus amylolyticus]